MDKKLRTRIILFYVFGAINGLLGLYVLLAGPSFLPPDNIRTLVIIFFLFAALNFYYPHAIRKKWLAENAGKQAQGNDPIQRQ